MARLTIQQTFDLALQHHKAGRLREAGQLYRQVLAQQAENTDAIHNLGKIALQVGRNDVAVVLIRRAISLRPNYAEAHYNLGNALKDQAQFDEAIAAYRQAIALRPNYTDAHNNLGIALREKGELNEAISAYRQAIALRSNYAEAHNNLGEALKENGQLDEAIAAYQQAIALNPNLPEAHNNFSYALLCRGDFQQGWQELEWRWKCNFSHFPRRNFTQQQWDGCRLEGRTILLQTEQGLGDSLQFIRYFHPVAQRAGRIVIECQAELQRLLQTMARGCQVVARGQPLPAFDLHCPLLTLPRIFGTTLANIPNTVPYLHADAEDAGRWQHRLAEHCPVVKVGLVWAGDPNNPNDRNRSMKLGRLAPLGKVPGVSFFSLQKGAAAAQAKTPPPGLELVDWSDELKDFADTAALIANLDLVIAVDTAVVHLAGAMGKPVWTLLPYVPDWRWLLEREDSPWYPTMRLFRQSAWGDWDSVIRRVAAELAQHKSNRG
jgi:Flp pilus assembly protein TadD